MKTIAHISDVHFGREDPAIVAGILPSVERAKPDVIVVSGDLTQRAKKKQFRAARAFLRELPKVPRIIVPGNHDVSWSNLFERAVRPLERYKRYITDDLNPFFDDGEVAIAGINTVRVTAIKDGRLNLLQVRTACEQLEGATENAVRVVVTHHPIDMPIADLRHALVSRAAMAMQEFSKAHVDLFLSGHFHTSLALVTSTRYNLPGYSAVVAHAGTAVSTRTRGVPNSWNRIEIGDGRIHIQQMVWTGKRFEKGSGVTYERCDEGWRPEEKQRARADRSR